MALRAGRGANSAQQTGQELTAALLQEDGTLGVILRDAPALEALLDALCGVTGPKEQDSEARAALAESIELLVSAQARCGMLPSPVTWLHVQPRCRGGATGPGLALAGYMRSAVCHCDHVSFSTPAAKAQWPWVKGCVMLWQGVCSFPRVKSLLVVRADLQDASVPDDADGCCPMQVATDAGGQVLWDLKAPEMLRQG